MARLASLLTLNALVFAVIGAVSTCGCGHSGGHGRGTAATPPSLVVTGSSVAPFQVVTLGPSSLLPTDRVSVRFFDDRGYSVKVHSVVPNPIEVAAPVYVDATTGEVGGAATLSVEVITPTGTLPVAGKLSLAPLPSSVGPLGRQTLTYLNSVESKLLAATTDVRSLSPLPISTATLQAETATYVNGIAAIRSLIVQFQSTPNGGVQLAQLRDAQGLSHTIHVDAASLALSDRLVTARLSAPLMRSIPARLPTITSVNATLTNVGAELTEAGQILQIAGTTVSVTGLIIATYSNVVNPAGTVAGLGIGIAGLEVFTLGALAEVSGQALIASGAWLEDNAAGSKTTLDAVAHLATTLSGAAASGINLGVASVSQALSIGSSFESSAAGQLLSAIEQTPTLSASVSTPLPPPPLLPPPSQAQPAWTSLVPPQNSGFLRKIAASPMHATIGYLAVAQSSNLVGIYKTIDGGSSWMPSGNGIVLSGATALSCIDIAVSPSDDSVVFALTCCTIAGAFVNDVYKSSDGGQTWAPTNCPGATTVSTQLQDGQILFDPIDASILYVAFSTFTDQGVWRYSGGSWSPLPKPWGPSAAPFGLAGSPAMGIYSLVAEAVPNPSGVGLVDRISCYSTPSGGAGAWSLHGSLTGVGPAAHSFCVAPTGSTLFAICRKAATGGTLVVLRSRDGGFSWSEVTPLGMTAGPGALDMLLVTHPTDPMVQFASDTSGHVFKTSTEGDSWRALSLPVNLGWPVRLGVTPASPLTIFAASSDTVNSTLMISTTGGE